MNFDDALKHYLPRVWFGIRFIKYKYLGRGEPELHLVRHFVEPGTTAIDIGASFGMYSTELARHSDRVIAFEANPDVAALTRRIVPRNVDVINAALSSRAGRASLKMMKNSRGTGVTEAGTIAHDLLDDPLVINVETRRLDEFPVGRCSFIKIDVEGHEEAVLEGAANLIARERPILLVEVLEIFNRGGVARLAARYAAQSYDCLFLFDGKFRPAAEFDESRHQIPKQPGYVYNFLFVPAEKKERIMPLLPSG
jgi:FkbM family methyltransferase